MYRFYPEIKTAGYSAFVIYTLAPGVLTSYWMIPGTYFTDWDN